MLSSSKPAAAPRPPHRQPQPTLPLLLLLPLTAVATPTAAPASTPPLCPCSNGACLAGSTECLCRDGDLGHWGGPTCGECQQGYAGASCQVACDGGACNPCNGHGECDGGYSGTGKCTCFDTPDVGRWMGPACDACQPGHYGANCTLLCPTPDTCNGHGSCNEGRGGDGTCICHSGWDLRTACATCLTSRWGSDCRRSCLGTTQAPELPCSGHGTCSHGANGTGECTSCDTGWAGPSCATPCACRAEHGTCSSGTSGDGSCTCNPHRLPPDCAQCEAGHGGAACDTPCPGTLPCSGRGACDASTASCACSAGYTGLDCSTACPGTPPCSGNGACTPAATCACESTPSGGFWSGPTCVQCAPGYSGHTSPPGCTLPCPASPLGETCSGHGTCTEGVCRCLRAWDPPSYTDYCGVACGESGGAGGALCGCPRGSHGAGCALPCPGSTGGAECSGHGSCTAAGACLCDPPPSQWGGPACATACPADPSGAPCGFPGRGFCSATDASCSCRNGFYGTACEHDCPTASGTPCNGRGSCEGGRCVCQAGWMGSACESVCLCPAHSACSGGGCVCDPGFSGPECRSCAAGLHGGLCDQPCVHGTSSNRTCSCDAGFAGANCDTPCSRAPGPGGEICNSHGSCRSGGGDGSCDCDPGWFGTACTEQCSASACAATYRMEHPACNPDTGRCECASRWSGPSCAECSSAWWGSSCERPCLCSASGTCDRSTGACACYQSPSQGFFEGPTCAACAAGYVGVGCRARQVCTTPGNPLSPVVVDPISLSQIPVSAYPPYGLWLDTEAGGGYTYVGGNPIIAWNTQRPVEVDRTGGGASLSGVLRAMFGAPGSLHFVLAPGRVAATQLVTLSPVPRPPTGAFSNPLVQLVSPRVADCVAHHVIPETGGSYLFHVETESGISTLKVTSLGCPGPDVSQCAGASVVVSRTGPISVATAGPRYVFLARPSSSGGLPDLLTVSWDRGSAGRGPSLSAPEGLAFPGGVSAASIAFLRPLGERSAVAVADGIAGLAYVVRISYGRSSSSSKTSEAASLPPGTSATALEVDPFLGSAFVGGVDPGSPKPGKLYKVSVTPDGPVELYDVVTLPHTPVKGTLVPDIVAAMYVDSATRTLYTAASPDSSVKLLSFLLWEVGARGGAPTFSPESVAADGGTPVVVTGSGFAKLATGNMIAGVRLRVRGAVDCIWGGGANATAGEIINSTAVMCVAPPAAEGCGGQSLDIGIDGHRSTACGREVTRIPPWRVASVSPDRGPSSGGTVITVYGSGFADSPHIACRFATSCGVEGPAGSGGGSSNPCDPPCGGGAGGGSSALIASGPASVTFISAVEVRCVQPAASGGDVGTAFLDVSIDGCRPATSTPVLYTFTGEPAGLRVDGGGGGGGGGGGVAVQPNPLSLTAVFAPEVLLPPLAVSIVDAAGTPLQGGAELAGSGAANPPPRASALSTPISFRLTSPPSGNSLQGGVTRFTGDAGSGATAYIFDTLRLHLNASLLQGGGGSATVTLIVEAPLGPWWQSVVVTVTHGVPYGVRIAEQPSRRTAHSASGAAKGLLKIQPAVGLADLYGNDVDRLEGGRTEVINCTVIDEFLEASDAARRNLTMSPLNPTDTTTTDTTPAPSDTVYTPLPQTPQPLCEVSGDTPVCRFSGVWVDAVFGVSYRLRFASVSSPSLRPADSWQVHPALCAGWQHQRVTDPPSAAQCELCPEGASCNGSSVLSALPGFWRASPDTLEFHSCRGGDSVCIGGSEQGDCAPPYTGPLCGACSPGYTSFVLTTCSACLPALNAVVFFIIALGVTAGIAAVATLADSEEGLGVRVTPSSAARMRIILSHFQRCSLLGGVFIVGWGVEQVMLLYVFTLPAGQAGLDCWVRGAGWSQRAKFIGYSVALVVISLASATFAMAHNRYFRGDERCRREARLKRRKRAMFSSMLCRTTPLTIFLLYLDTLRHASMLMMCSSVNSHHEDRLIYDAELSCDTAAYREYLAGAVVVFLTLALGLPVAIIFSGFLVEKAGGGEGGAAGEGGIVADFLGNFFTVFTAGLTPSHQHWESVVMLEKALLCLAIYVTSGGVAETQFNLTGWVAVCGLLTALSAMPYSDPANNTLEATSRMVFLLTVYCLHLLHSSDLVALEEACIRALVVVSQLGFVAAAAASLFADMTGRVDDIDRSSGLRSALLSLIVKERAAFASTQRGSDARQALKGAPTILRDGPTAATPAAGVAAVSPLGAGGGVGGVVPNILGMSGAAAAPSAGAQPQKVSFEDGEVTFPPAGLPRFFPTDPEGGGGVAGLRAPLLGGGGGGGGGGSGSSPYTPSDDTTLSEGGTLHETISVSSKAGRSFGIPTPGGAVGPTLGSLLSETPPAAGRPGMDTSLGTSLLGPSARQYSPPLGGSPLFPAMPGGGNSLLLGGGVEDGAVGLQDLVGGEHELTCTFCGVGFTDLQNLPGCCQASVLSAKRHLALAEEDAEGPGAMFDNILL